MSKKVIVFIIILILLVIVGVVAYFMNQNSNESENNRNQAEAIDQTEENVQNNLLEAVQSYIDEGKVNSIRISTRPDYIDKTM